MLLGVGRRQRRVGAGPRRTATIFLKIGNPNTPYGMDAAVSLRRSCRSVHPHVVSAGPRRRKSCTGASRPCYDMVRETERASEGLAHHFAVESDELRLKTNVRGGPLSACLSHFHARRR